MSRWQQTTCPEPWRCKEIGAQTPHPPTNPEKTPEFSGWTALPLQIKETFITEARHPITALSSPGTMSGSSKPLATHLLHLLVVWERQGSLILSLSWKNIPILNRSLAVHWCGSCRTTQSEFPWGRSGSPSFCRFLGDKLLKINQRCFYDSLTHQMLRHSSLVPKGRHLKTGMERKDRSLSQRSYRWIPDTKTQQRRTWAKREPAWRRKRGEGRTACCHL